MRKYIRKKRCKKRISPKTVERLALYYEILITLPLRRKYISSEELGNLAGVSATTVRQDFLCFEEVEGKARKGYEVKKLKKALKEILNVDKKTCGIIIGAGKLGQAISGYANFKKSNICFKAFFDKDKRKIGKKINNIPILDIKTLPEFIKKNKSVEVAIVCIPPKEAQEVVENIVESGIKAIWNFSPTVLELPENVVIEYERIGVGFYKLLYNFKYRNK
ncbi:MAG TPA: redox-sensing transcriptional repressor Rex [Firmicutes bacterium]|nr:redox-sensing transcriptional repressor Rex [Bacillota bacterium]